MTAIKTDIGAQTQAEHAPFRPSSDIPASNTWDAIQYVKDALDALSGSLPGAYQPLDSDLTAIAGLTPSNDDLMQRKAGAWVNRSLAQFIADLAALGTTFQPLDSDLTAWAAITRASGFDSFAAAATSANLRALLDDETGGGAAVFQDSPTFTTLVTTPVVVGGSGTGSSLDLKSTTGVGATDRIRLLVGNNGAIEALRADTAGRIMIGGTASQASSPGPFEPRLQIHGIDSPGAFLTNFRWSADANGGGYAFCKSRGAAIGTHTIVQSGDQLGAFAWRGSDGTIFQAAAQVRGEVDGTPGASDMPGRILFLTTPDGAAAVSERLRIDSAGAISHRANAQVIIDANSHFQLRSYTVATLPSAATAGQLIYVSDGTSNKRLAVSDGTNWRFPDGNVVS